MMTDVDSDFIIEYLIDYVPHEKERSLSEQAPQGKNHHAQSPARLGRRRR